MVRDAPPAATVLGALTVTRALGRVTVPRVTLATVAGEVCVVWWGWHVTDSY